MATPGVMLRELLFDTNFTFITEVAASREPDWFFTSRFEVSGAIQKVGETYASATDSVDTLNVPSYETTRFASMAGMLANHPLRDDWLENMGLSPDIDLDVL